MEFHCPKCGSYMFGSSRDKDGKFTRHCHGNEIMSCGFTFPQADDDKYFRPQYDKLEAENARLREAIKSALRIKALWIYSGEIQADALDEAVALDAMRRKLEQALEAE